MKGRAIRFYVLDGAQKGRILEKRAVLNGDDDAGEVMVNDAARAHREVADFRVAGLSPRQSNRRAGGLEGRKGVVLLDGIEIRFCGGVNGIAADMRRDAEAVEHDEDDWFWN